MISLFVLLCFTVFINIWNIGYLSLCCMKLRPIIISSSSITIISSSSSSSIIKEDYKALSLISLTRLFNVILRWSKAVVNENIPFTYWEIFVFFSRTIRLLGS